MYIHQISVFVENKPGNIANFTNFLAEHKIDMRAFQIADSSDFGIIRIIVPPAVRSRSRPTWRSRPETAHAHRAR